jgi:nicotinate-nucleotide pyrophosphorylase (carboxylating)
VVATPRRWVRAAREVRIRDTRKTTPGLRALEKAAVRAGGGTNHRGSLSDGILVKDNHLGSLSVADAIRRARLRWPGRVIEVECDSIDQLEAAIEAGAEMALLDNMIPDMVARAVEVAAGRIVLEVSGGVTLDNLPLYAETGVDFISAGAITHSAPSFDIGLDLEV